jgi:hypothetical protein
MQLPSFDRSETMPIPLDLPKLIEDLTEAVLADILKSSTPEEIRQLIKELELRQWKSGLH